MTHTAERRQLLHIARQAILEHVLGGRRVLEGSEPEGFSARCGGAFVTLHAGRDLRGCIGYTEVDKPLFEVVARCAVAACSSDPRFSPITEAELPTLDIELSLLGALEAISGPADFEIGRHGLLVEKGRQRGLLLPQVAIQWHWDRDQFLSQTCHKAGLPRDGWEDGARLWRFEAEVFSEATTAPAV